MAKEKDKKKALEAVETSVKGEVQKVKKEKSTKSKKDDGKKKPNRFVKWFKDLWIEFKHVTWPTKHTVLVNTGVVLGTIIISSVFVGLLDLGLLKLAEFLIGLSQ